MTETQAIQIRELRLQGAGYKAIASGVGLSRDVVRNYCKTHDLDGYAVEVVANTKEQGGICPWCSQVMRQPGTGRKRRFCSDTCRRRWWANHPEESQKQEAAFYEKTCVYCGRPFTRYGNKNNKYCSHKCYVRDRYYRVEEDREPYISPAKGGNK